MLSCRSLPLTGLKSGRFLYRRKNEQTFKEMPNVADCISTPLVDSDRDAGCVERQSRRARNNDEDGADSSTETISLRNQSDCFLSFTAGVCVLKFQFPARVSTNVKESSRPTGHGYVVLECLDITAADLRVTSKFGSWDTMVGRLLVECSSPVRVCSVYGTDMGVICEGSILNCCMVKATFDIKYLQDAREILHSLKLSRNADIRLFKGKKRRGEVDVYSPPGKIREGLPEWVNYIPYKWYSAGLRKGLEYLLVLYTVLSLLWAFWQLYKHVDFVKAYLRPLLDFLEYYVIIVKSWLIWLDQLTTLMSQYWWRYMKPFYIIFVTAMAPVIKLFTPLKSIVNIIPHLLEPVFQFLNIIYAFMHPVISPLYSVFDLVLIKGMKFLLDTLGHIFATLANTGIVKVVTEKGSQTFIVRLISELLHGKLDPIKAQVVVIRDLIFKSLKSIFIGARFIASRVYYMVIFVQREKQYAKEESVAKDTGNTNLSSIGSDRVVEDKKLKMQ